MPHTVATGSFGWPAHASLKDMRDLNTMLLCLVSLHDQFQIKHAVAPDVCRGKLMADSPSVEVRSPEL